MSTTGQTRSYLPREIGKRVPVEQLIETAKVVDILPLNRMPLVYIPASSTIAQALAVLALNNITSAPVYDPTGNWYVP